VSWARRSIRMISRIWRRSSAIGRTWTRPRSKLDRCSSQ
jgi:hypothetical protein